MRLNDACFILTDGKNPMIVVNSVPLCYLLKREGTLLRDIGLVKRRRDKGERIGKRKRD
jgi:hypothetical protein